MAPGNVVTIRQALSQIVPVFSHDPRETGRLAALAFFGLAAIGLWGLYGDLLFSNLLVVAVAEMLIICYVGSVAFFVGRVVRSYDRWQVESALTLRDLLSEGGDGGAHPLAGSPFYARQLRLRLDEDIRRCKEYGTSFTVVALRLELSTQRPSRASFTQANFDMAQLAMSHGDVLVAPTVLGMYEYAFILPNCDRRAAQSVKKFVAGALRRYRCSFGLAVFPEDGEDCETLLQCAIEECGLLNRAAA